MDTNILTEQDSSSQKRISLLTVFKRAIKLRCPICGKGKLFLGYFKMYENCEVCNLKFEQEPGYFLGSTYINYALTAGITTVTYVGLHFFVGIKRDILIYPVMTFCIVFPLFFFRYARAFWIGLDKLLETFGPQNIPGDDIDDI